MRNALELMLMSGITLAIGNAEMHSNHVYLTIFINYSISCITEIPAMDFFSYHALNKVVKFIEMIAPVAVKVSIK